MSRGKFNKYHAKKIKADGMTFDSKHEYRRWQELCEMQERGEIRDLERQVKFLLIPAQYEYTEKYSEKTGKRLKDKRRCLEQQVSYVADFAYKNRAGFDVIEDAKGRKTKDYIIKRKLMLHVHGIRVQEV